MSVLSTKVNALESSLAAIMSHLGIGEQAVASPKSRPSKTSAREQSREIVSHKKAPKGQKHEDVEITITRAMSEGRMKLPNRMFTKGSKVVVDGHTFTQQPQDQNRSTKFNPEIFGAEEGDTCVFSFVGGREWSVEVFEGKPAKKQASKPAKSGSTKSGSKAKADKPTKSAGSKVASPKREETVSQFIQRFADIAIENAEDEDFEQNTNILSTGSFDSDARVYFTTAENQKFRAGRKRLGLTLAKSVSLLNAAVYE